MVPFMFRKLFGRKAPGTAVVSRQSAGTIDAGSIFAREFGRAENIYGLTAPELLSVLQTPQNGNEIRREARYLARVSPHLAEFVRATTRGVLPGLQRPQLPVEDRAADWWVAHWSGVRARGELTGLEFEEMCWRAFVVDGEIFLGRHSDEQWEMIAADDVEVEVEGGSPSAPWPMVWKVRDRRVRAGEIIHIANRDDPASVRGRSLLAYALPPARSLTGIMANSGQGAVVMARIIAVLEAQGSGGLAMQAAAQGIGGSGLDDPGTPTAETGDLGAFPPGSIPVLPTGTKLAQHEYGLPEHMPAHLALLVEEIATGLGVSRHALDGDVSRANFASLRTGFVRDQNTFDDLASRWCRDFRQAIWRFDVLDAIAAGKVPARVLRTVPTWVAPHRADPNPEKSDPAMIASAEVGLVDLDRERIRRGLPPKKESAA